jgi:hypothetical protein
MSRKYGGTTPTSVPDRVKRFFCTSHRLGAHPASCSVVTVGSFPVLKLQEREADHSPQSSVEITNGGAIPSHTHTSSMHDA